MLFSILKKIKFKGKIDIIDYKGDVHSFGNSLPYSKVRLTSKSIERKLYRNPSLYIGEGYMDEEIIIEDGTIEDFINVITLSYEEFTKHNLVFKTYEKILNIFKPLQNINMVSQSKKNVAHHYDLNENLYRLMLDKDMQYSCAYFHNENISLEQAQNDKKKHIIEKLQIKDDMEVLDIGCGWGGMAIQIAKDTGASVKGITLSENQFVSAQQRAQAEGLSEKVKFSLQDYRHEKNKYDRIVSVGMFEHVGANHFPEFFSTTYDLLKEKGVFLLHTIGQRGKPAATSSWIRKYIFPGGYIPTLSEITKVTEKYDINITDVEVLRIHYAYTLSHWYRRIMDHKKEIVQMFDDRFLRMWEFYLLISKYSFINMGNVVYQIQIARNIHNLPLTRNYIYN